MFGLHGVPSFVLKCVYVCVCVWSLPHVMKWLGIQLVNLSNDFDLRGRSWYGGHVCNACLIYRSFDPTSENQIYTLILWSVLESEASKYLKLCIPKFPAYDMRAMSANLVCFSSGLPDIISFCQTLGWGFGKTKRLKRPTWESPNHQEGISDVSIGCSMEIIHASRSVSNHRRLFKKKNGHLLDFQGSSGYHGYRTISDIIRLTSCNSTVGLRTWQPCTISPTWFTWCRCSDDSDGLQDENPDKDWSEEMWHKTCLIRQGKAFANSITFSFKTLVTHLHMGFAINEVFYM